MCCDLLKSVPLGIALTIFTLAAPAQSARQGTTLATLTGKCARAMVMNVVADPRLCSDKVSNLRMQSGAVGFAFLLHPNGELGPLVVSFLFSRPKAAMSPGDAAILPVHRVHVTFDGRTDDLIALGSCAYSGPGRTILGKVSCFAPV